MRYFFLLLGLIMAAPSARAEIAMAALDCDTIITTSGQVLLISVVSQDDQKIYYQDCDRLSDKTQSISRTDIKSLKLTRRDTHSPAFGVPGGAEKWHALHKNRHRNAISILFLGIFAALFTMLTYGLLALGASGLMIVFFLALTIILVILTAVKCFRFLKQTKADKATWESERNLAIVGLSISGAIIGLIMTILIIYGLFSLFFLLLGV